MQPLLGFRYGAAMLRLLQSEVLLGLIQGAILANYYYYGYHGRLWSI